jgi:hypothetical protein
VARSPHDAAPSISSSKMVVDVASRAVQAISSGSCKFLNTDASPLSEASSSSSIVQFVNEGVSGNLRDNDSDIDFSFMPAALMSKMVMITYLLTMLTSLWVITMRKK